MKEVELSQQQNKRSILKSTTLLGGSSFITILIGMVRVKFVAILLGPSGVGFMGVLTGLRDIISTVAGLGLSSSGVRQIASSVAQEDDKAIALTVKALRILMRITGTIGMLVMIGGAVFWSQISFKTAEYTIAIAFLGLSVLFTAISSGQSTILQGHRRIADVAKINIIGAITGTLIGLPCYFFWGMNGVVPSLVLGSIAMLATSWWFAHKIGVINVLVDISNIKNETKRLLVFGMPLMLSGLINNLVAYIIRVFLTRESGLDAVGQYQAAFSLAGVLVSFVLGAMGTDYYPRLTAVADDNEKINSEVNTQTEIALLLAVPALAATIVFMSLVMQIFYSSSFLPAIVILRWAVFGILGRVISWPMGFIMLAKAKGKLFFITEMISGIVQVVMVMLCYHFFGLSGCGIAFAFLYIWHIILMLIVSKKIADFSWSFNNIKLIVIAVLCIAFLSLIQILQIKIFMKYIIGIIILLIVSYFFLTILLKSSGITFLSIKNRLRK